MSKKYRIEYIEGAEFGGLNYFVDQRASSVCWDNLASFRTQKEAEEFIATLPPAVPADTVCSDASELRDIANEYAERGKPETAEFLRAIATRIDVMAGAFRKMQSRLDQQCEPMTIDEIDALAQEQNVWTTGGIIFDFITFAREIEIHHGITAPSWEITRDYCS